MGNTDDILRVDDELSIAYPKSNFKNEISYEFHFRNGSLYEVLIAYYKDTYRDINDELFSQLGRCSSSGTHYDVWQTRTAKIANNRGDLRLMGFYGYVTYEKR